MSATQNRIEQKQPTVPVSASKVKLVQKLLHRSAPCLFWVFGITFGFSYIKMLNKAFTRYL